MTDEAPLVTDEQPEHTSWSPLESEVTLGVAVVDITPPVVIRAHNWGASRTGQATGVHRPLTASAVAIEDGDTWRYLVTADLGWWQALATYRAVVDPVLERLDTDADHFLLHLVHTHAGPSLHETDGDQPGGDLVLPYLDTLVDALVEVCIRAKADATGAVITWAYGSSRLATARDLPCGPRQVVGFTPGKKADDTLAVGRVTVRDSGQVIATVVNYACHPTTLAFRNSLLSPDYIGAMRELVTDATDAPCLFFQGASGDLAPREQYAAGTEDADRHGRELGHAVLAVVESMGKPATQLAFTGVVESGAPLAIWEPRSARPNNVSQFAASEVVLPCRPAVGDDELAHQWAHIDPVAARERIARAQRLADGYRDGDQARHPVWAWTIGDATIVAHPGEAFSDLQIELRARHPERMVLVLNLTGAPGFMYLPDREQYQEDSYQVWQTLLARGALERLTDHADVLVQSAPEPRSSSSSAGASV